MGIETDRFDRHLERITTREQAIRHLEKILELGGSFNPSSQEAEVHESPDSLTDLVIFFRSDNEELATTDGPYTLFLNRYDLADGTIPSYKFKVDTWNGTPCLRVRIAE